jgi:hypothetical protein
MREARQGAAGWSQVGSPSSRDQARISSLVSPASSSGERTPFSPAATAPGRWSPTSSALEPSSITAPRSAATAESRVHSSDLQK